MKPEDDKPHLDIMPEADIDFCSEDSSFSRRYS